MRYGFRVHYATVGTDNKLGLASFDANGNKSAIVWLAQRGVWLRPSPAGAFYVDYPDKFAHTEKDIQPGDRFIAPAQIVCIEIVNRSAT